jgi:hypothetical protein
MGGCLAAFDPRPNFEDKKMVRTNLSVEGIIKKYLRENGFDGLCNCEMECGCLLENLVPCDSLDEIHCEPGYRVSTPDKDGGYIVSPKKMRL